LKRGSQTLRGLIFGDSQESPLFGLLVQWWKMFGIAPRLK